MVRISKSAGVLVAMVCLLAASSAAFGGDEGSASVMRYLAQRAGKLAAQRPPLPDAAAAWEKHRGKLLTEVGEWLGLPAREAMKAAATHQAADGDLAVDEVIFHWAGPTYAAGHIIRLKEGGGRRPALVICPGYLAHYTWLGYRQFVERIARSGVVVLFLEDPRIGKRVAADAGLYAAAAASGTPVLGIQVFDALRGLDYLVTRPDVDPGRIGVTGIGAGARQAWLAAALEPRFRVVVAIDGATTCQRLAQLVGLKPGSIADPSMMPSGLLGHAEWGEIAACVAPRPTLVVANTRSPFRSAGDEERVLGTGRKIYALVGAAGALARATSDGEESMAACLPQIEPWLAEQFKSLPPSGAAPLPCGKPDKPDFKVMAWLRGRIANQAASRAESLKTQAQWHAYRERVARWLDEACALKTMQPGPAKVIAVSKAEGLVVERLSLSIDAGLTCPAVLVHPASSAGQKQPGVIFSPDGRHSAESPEVQATVRQLATQGSWVLVPEHVSIHAKSPRRLALADVPGFIAAAELAGFSPLALRVAEDVAAFRYLSGRPEVDAARVVAAGSGVGAIDAGLSAVLEPRLAGVAAVNVTTFRDWAENVAPEEVSYVSTLPYLPGILAVTDFDVLFAAIAPRPLMVARLKEGWPKSAFEQVAATASAVYRLEGAEKALAVVGLRDPLDERIAKLPDGAQKQVAAVVRAILPAPPVPGVVGARDALRSHDTVDSAAALVWLVEKVGGEEQEFCDGGYRLDTWSFFNDNKAAQQGRAITPLVFKKEGNVFKLTGIGKTRINDGSGLQTFPFEAVQGSDQVGAGHFFGFYTGDPAGKPNGGVVEYSDDDRDRMVILTLDGAMEGQKVAVGRSYREQSHWPRAYAVLAVSKRK